VIKKTNFKPFERPGQRKGQTTTNGGGGGKEGRCGKKKDMKFSGARRKNKTEIYVPRVDGIVRKRSEGKGGKQEEGRSEKTRG